MNIITINNNFPLHSFYNYDPSGSYLTSVNTGDITLDYTYNEKGDLTNATGTFGAKKVFSYDENDWIEKIENFDSNSELKSSTEYKISKNGQVDMFVSPMNTSRSLVHDKMGGLVSITNDDGLPEMSIELPYGRKHVVGDEVSTR